MSNWLKKLEQAVVGGGAGFLTGGPAGAAVGALGALTTPSGPGKAAARASKTAQQSQQQLQAIAAQLQQRYATAAPAEQQAIQYFMQRAGLNPGGYGSTTAMGQRDDLNGGRPFALTGSRANLPGTKIIGGNGPGLVGGSMGVFNSPEYQLLRQAAEEDVAHQANQQRLAANAALAQRGIQGSSVAQGAQAAIAANANKTYADYARQLALSAANKQDTLAQQALGSLQGALGGGVQAGGLLSGAGNLALQGQLQNQGQQNTLSSALGSAIGNAAKYWAERGANQTPIGTIGGIAPGDTSGDTPAPGSSPAPYGPPIPRATGGPVLAGHEYMVGEAGPELMLARSPGMILPNPATAPHPRQQLMAYYLGLGG